MRRNPHNQSDPRKNPDDKADKADQADQDDAERRRDGGIDPEPEAEPQRVSRRTDPDETEEIDLADDDVEEMSEMEEEGEADARKGEGPDA